MTFIFSILGIVATLFIAVIAGTLVGGIVGWLAGAAGVGLTAFGIGAVMGFVSGFVKANCNSK